MSTNPPEPRERPDSSDDDFASLSAQGRHGRIREFWEFLRDNKKWWILPILLVALLLGFVMVLGPAIQAFLYPL